MWFEKPDDAIIQSDGTFWSIMVQHTLIRLQGEWLTEGRIFTRHIFRIAWLNFYWAPRRLCSARDTGVLCVRGKPLTSPGQWAACVPAATQRLWGDGAGCTGNRTPAAHGSATGPRTPVGRENSRWIKQSDGDRKTSWLLTSARLHNPPVATGRNTAVFGTFTKLQ